MASAGKLTTVAIAGFGAVGSYESGWNRPVNGALGKNMMPLFPALSGKGSLQTSEVVLKDFPALEKAVDVTKLNFLDNPTLRALNLYHLCPEVRHDRR